jgi:RNA polymerase sigma-70 factor (ECF subfamily)
VSEHPTSIDLAQASDDDLARRSRDGDAGALSLLYTRHAPTLLGYLRRLLPDRDDAEDVLQDTFLRLFEARGTYEGRGRFRSWLFTVATRQAHDRLRQRRRRDVLAETYGDELRPARAEGPTDEAGRSLLTRTIEAILGDLPPSYATAFHLRVREELSYREIAALSGEPEGTLRSRVHHALRRIRAALASDGSIPRSPIDADATSRPLSRKDPTP